MKTSKAIIAVFLLLSLSAGAQEKWSRLKIYPPADKHAKAELLGLLQIDHFTTDSDGGIVTELGEKELNKLKIKGHKYKILVPDIARELDSVNKKYFASVKNKRTNSKVAFETKGSTINNIIPTPSTFQVKSTFGGYYSFAEMETAMNNLVASFPSIAKKTSIGKTYEGRDIWVIKISDNVATEEASEQGILYMGLQHAREAITGASMIFFMEYLCENYGTDTKIKNLVDNREFYIIPCFNPDGWEYNGTSMSGSAGGGWRKNRKVVDSLVETKKKAGVWETTVTPLEWGVDLNRNWGVDWSNCNEPISGSTTSCGSPNFSDDTYWGTAAFSEAETQAVRDFVKTHNIIAGFDQHAFGPYYSLPFGRQTLHTMPQKGQDFYTAIPALMGTYNGMRAADSYDALGYEVAGGFKDWMLMGEVGVGTKDTVWAMTGEGGAGGGSGGSYSSFWAPASQILNLCKGMAYQNLQLAYAAGTYVDIQDASDIAVTALSGNFNFKLKRIGLGNSPVTVSLEALENIETTGAAVTVNSMVYYGTHNGSISYTLPSSIMLGQKLKFVWKVSTEGYSFTDTIVKFYSPTTLFYDDMEGTLSTNWTASSNVADNWSYSSLSAYNGSKSLTESPAGNYTASTTRTITYTGGNGGFDLTNATASHLSFWVKHRAENFRDKLQVQVSTNGASWTAIAGKTTIQEAGTLDGSTINGQPSLTGIQDFWVQEVFDLQNYLGTPKLYLRFVFTSDGDASSFRWEKDDGFYIDELRLIKTSALFTVLPVKFIDVNANLVAEKTVNINWSTVTDDKHDYFEVERSSDGIHFTTIGNVRSSAPYNLVDKKVSSGYNYYRIKEVSKNGTVLYSKVVHVYIEDNYTVQVLPNPVTDVLIVKLNTAQTGSVSFEISDIQGRIMHREVKQTGNYGSEVKIATKNWKPQLYILKVMNNNNEVISIQKIIKK